MSDDDDIVTRLRPGGGVTHVSAGVGYSEGHLEPKAGCLQCDAAAEIELLRDIAAKMADVLARYEWQGDGDGDEYENTDVRNVLDEYRQLDAAPRVTT